MARSFDILARVRADAAQFTSELAGAFGGAERRGKKAADTIGKRFTKAAGKAAGTAFKAGAGGLVGAFGFGIKEALDLEKALDDIAIQAGSSDEAMAGLRASIRRTSEDTGIGQVELAKAGKTLVDLLGPAGQNAELLDLLGKTAVASGADVGDLAGLVSAVSDSFGVGVGDIDGMRLALSAFLSAGKQGKVPLSEMNQVLQEVASNFAEMSSGGTNAAADVAAALQVARTAFGTAGQAGTGLKSGATALKVHSDKIDKAIRKIGRKQGIAELRQFTVWADETKTKLKDFRELAPVLSKMNLDELSDSLGSAEAGKFWSAFQGEGFDNFLAMADPARKATDVVDDFAKRTGDESFRMAQAWNRVKLAIADAITPEVIEQFVSAVESLSSVLQFAARHVSAVVSALAALKALQMLAHFSGLAKGAGKLAGALDGVAGSAGSAGAQVSGLQKISAGATGLFAGLSVGQAIGGAIVDAKQANFDRQVKRNEQAMSETEAAASATQRLVEANLVDEQGRLTAEGEAIRARGEAKRALGRELSPQEQDIQTALSGFEIAKAAHVGGGIGGIVDTVMAPFSSSAPAERRALVSSEETAMTRALQANAAALDMLRQEIRDNTAATKDATPNGRKPARGSVGDLGAR
jgi:hypothetical protein